MGHPAVPGFFSTAAWCDEGGGGEAHIPVAALAADVSLRGCVAVSRYRIPSVTVSIPV